MSDAVAVAPTTPEKKKVAAKAKKPAAKPKAPKKPANHPKYNEMIQKAITALKERGGSSRQAIQKYIQAQFNVGKDEKSIAAHLRLALKRGVVAGNLKQVKGTGASGSFRVAEKAAKKPAAAKKAKKPAAAKKAKKPAGEKKVKTPKKKAAAKPKKPASAKKSPAKAKKPAAPKKAAKPKAPKKKTTPKKKPAAAKKPAKK